MSTSIDIFQQIFKFTMLADGVNDLQKTREELEQGLKQQVTDEIKDTEWQLKWGPTVWKRKPDESTYPANSWYIVHHPEAQFEDGSIHPTYVIVIAGTPLHSHRVIEMENNAVDTVVDFNAWVTSGIKNEPVSLSSSNVSPGIPYFATGTAWGTFRLVNTKSLAHDFAPGNTIVEYLSTQNQSPSTRFIIAGHSLGGCLTTSLALTLVNAWVLPSANTLTYSIAGASAGNVEWANQFTSHFPPSKSPDNPEEAYMVWNRNLVNNLDIFPQHWCHVKDVSPQQWLGRIPAIYGTPVLDDVIQLVVQYAARSVTSGVVYKPIPGQYFDSSLPPASAPPTLDEFESETLKQHRDPYYHVFHLEPPSSLGASASSSEGA